MLLNFVVLLAVLTHVAISGPLPRREAVRQYARSNTTATTPQGGGESSTSDSSSQSTTNGATNGAIMSLSVPPDLASAALDTSAAESIGSLTSPTSTVATTLISTPAQASIPNPSTQPASTTNAQGLNIPNPSGTSPKTNGQGLQPGAGSDARNQSRSPVEPTTKPSLLLSTGTGVGAGTGAGAGAGAGTGGQPAPTQGQSSVTPPFPTSSNKGASPSPLNPTSPTAPSSSHSGLGTGISNKPAANTAPTATAPAITSFAVAGNPNPTFSGTESTKRFTLGTSFLGGNIGTAPTQGAQPGGGSTSTIVEPESVPGSSNGTLASAGSNSNSQQPAQEPSPSTTSGIPTSSLQSTSPNDSTGAKATVPLFQPFPQLTSPSAAGPASPGSGGSSGMGVAQGPSNGSTSSYTPQVTTPPPQPVPEPTSTSVSHITTTVIEIVPINPPKQTSDATPPPPPPPPQPSQPSQPQQPQQPQQPPPASPSATQPAAQTSATISDGPLMTIVPVSIGADGTATITKTITATEIQISVSTMVQTVTATETVTAVQGGVVGSIPKSAAVQAVYREAARRW